MGTTCPNGLTTSMKPRDLSKSRGLREIVTSVQEESDSVEDETDEDEDNNNNESSKGSSNADVFSALETAME
ncbi:hypothetical protein TNCV_1062291 [Trichonephila clavipes]|nr:hypothetical protein TNCV_1062291 [Trichonephila clavipes]